MPSPSASAAPRMGFARMAPAASGLRPIASFAAAVAMPTPMPGPRTPKPTAMPAARPANSMVRFLSLRGLVRGGVCCFPFSVFLTVAFEGQDEVHEHEEPEHEALDEADEDLEASKGNCEPR